MPENYKDTVKKILKSHNNDVGDLIGVLQDIQAQYRYLPREALDMVAKNLKAPINRVYAVATFFRAFYLEPRGKHDCVVCTGTACHVRGANRIVDELSRLMNCAPGGTSKDKKFSLDTVNCLGSCALGPVMTIDGNIHGKLTARNVRKIVNQYEEPRGNKKDETEKRGGSGKKKTGNNRKTRSK